MIAKLSPSQAAAKRVQADPLLRGADAALRRAAIKAQERARAVNARREAEARSK